MDGIALRHWPKALGAVLGLLLLLSLTSFHLQDPTLTNLRLPSGGVRNWLGLPGALLGGSLLELLGSAALAAPVLWLNWALCARNRPALHRYAFWSVCLLLALSGLHGLAAAPREPGLLDAGLVGWAVRRWCGLTTGPWAGAALLAYLGLFAAGRVAYAPAARKGAREARMVAGWLLRAGWHRGRAGAVEMRRRAARLRRVSGATALGLTRRMGLGLRGLLGLALLLPRAAASWLAAWRAPSLAGIKARTADSGRAFGARPGRAAGAGAAMGASLADSFDDWLHTPEPEPATGPAPGLADRPAAGGGAMSHPALPPWRRRPPVLEDPPEPPDASPAPSRAGTPTAAPHPSAALAPSAAGALALPAEHAADPELAEFRAPAPEPLGTTSYEFERPEAEAAWRLRFQRYARNLDLDWEEQLGARAEAGGGSLGPAAEDEGADDEAPAPEREP
jgi:hypothetical protein